MKNLIKLLSITFFVSSLFISCEKKPLTLDENTSMKTLLNASDTEITELALKEAEKTGMIEREQVKIEYIIKDKESNAIAVKMKINKDE